VFGLQDAPLLQGQRGEVAVSEPRLDLPRDGVLLLECRSHIAVSSSVVPARMGKEGLTMLPHVTVHNAASLGGRLLRRGMVHLATYCGLVRSFAQQAKPPGRRRCSPARLEGDHLELKYAVGG
jgi:hypothetical protein